MKIKSRAFRYSWAVLLGAILLGVTAVVGFAQQITGAPGSPSTGGQ